MLEFRINDFLTLKLENEKTNIYVNNELFNQCKHIIIERKTKNLVDLFEIESIDELIESRSFDEEENILRKISPETEFWVHCSNLQAWEENSYDAKLIHSNLAFPLLKKLTEIGDSIARKVFKEEISKRFFYGTDSTQRYLYEEGYLDNLSKDEIFSFINEDLSPINEIEEIIQKEIKVKSRDARTGQGIIIEDMKIKHLILQNCDLRQLPDQIRKLKNLKTLSLHGNLLESIPKWIGELINLEKLEIQHNRLKKLTESIGKLKNLKTLKLYNNQLEFLPESIGNLTKLEYLDLDSNKIKTLPIPIGDLSSLEVLNVNKNYLKSIPDSFGNLKSLKEANFDGNLIRSLPEESIENLMSLESLNLAYNPLNNFPGSLLKLTNLKYIYLKGTELVVSKRIIKKLQENKIKLY